MIKPSKKALKILQVTASGGATVLLSTFTSCYLAVLVEKTAHRVQYHFFPHWYKDVDFALGLDLHKKIQNSQMTKHENNNHHTTTHSIESKDEITNSGIDFQVKKDTEDLNIRINDDTVFSNASSTLSGTCEQSYGFDNNHSTPTSSSTMSGPIHTSNNETLVLNQLESFAREESVTTEEYSLSANTMTNNDDSDNATTSRMRSFLGLVGSNSSDNVTNVLQSCAMTA